MKLTEEALIKQLNEWELKPTYQKETGQTYITMKVKEFEVHVFFGIRSESTLLQIVAYLPYNLNPKTLPQVARLFHMLNKELDVPGFCIDEENDLMFYRLVMPCLGQEYDPKLLNLYLGTTRMAVDTFIQAIAMIVSGSTTIEQVLKDSQDKP